MSDALTELRPPPEHAGKRFHWLCHSHDRLHDPDCLHSWNGRTWQQTLQPSAIYTPAEMAKHGWYYVRPWLPKEGMLRRCAVHRWKSTQQGSGCPYCAASDGGTYLMAQQPAPSEEHAKRIAELEVELRGAKDALHSVCKADANSFKQYQARITELGADLNAARKRIAELEREQRAEDENRNWSA